MRAIIQRIWALKCSVIFLGVFVFWGKPLLTQTLVDHGGKHMPHPKVVNLYWDDNWDRDHATNVINAPKPMTQGNIDDFVRFLAGGSYFAKAAQYGVEGISFGGSFGSSPDCGGLKAGATISSFDVDAWVHCRVSHAGTDVPRPSPDDQMSYLYMIYLPKGTLVKNHGFFETCGDVGYHASTLRGGYVFAVILAECQNNDFRALTTTISHEIIEAMTDPYLTGWTAPGASTQTIPAPPPPPLLPALPSITIPVSGEIADLCQTPTGFPFFGFNVESYWSNSDSGCALGNETQAVWTSPLQIQPMNPIVLQGGSMVFTVAPSIPVRFYFPFPPSGSGDQPGITDYGTLFAASASSDYLVDVGAAATDGSGRSSRTVVQALMPIQIDPGSAAVVEFSNQQFSERHHLPVEWSVEGTGNGSITSDTGIYTAPATNRVRMVTITAAVAAGSGSAQPPVTPRPPAHLAIFIAPFFRRTGGRVAVGSSTTIAVPADYGVCSGKSRAECLRIYPDRKHIIRLHISPPLGHVGDLGSKLRHEYLDQLLHAKGPDAAKLRGKIEQIDSTYHAPTRSEWKAAGLSPDKPVEIIITPEDFSGGEPMKASTKLSLLPGE